MVLPSLQDTYHYRGLHQKEDPTDFLSFRYKTNKKAFQSKAKCPGGAQVRQVWTGPFHHVGKGGARLTVTTENITFLETTYAGCNEFVYKAMKPIWADFTSFHSDGETKKLDVSLFGQATSNISFGTGFHWAPNCQTVRVQDHIVRFSRDSLDSVCFAIQVGNG